MLTALSAWPARRWGVAAMAAFLSTIALAIPAALIPNPIFGRAIEPEWWSWPVTIATGILAGLVIATYVNVSPAMSPAVSTAASSGSSSSDPDSIEADSEAFEVDTIGKDTAGRAGVIGGLVSFFAVGCPVCNKLVLVALGSTGALQWFAPIQPILAVAALGLLIWALRRRLQGEVSCKIPARQA